MNSSPSLSRQEIDYLHAAIELDARHQHNGEVPDELIFLFLKGRLDLAWTLSAGFHDEFMAAQNLLLRRGLIARSSETVPIALGEWKRPDGRTVRSVVDSYPDPFGNLLLSHILYVDEEMFSASVLTDDPTLRQEHKIVDVEGKPLYTLIGKLGFVPPCYKNFGGSLGITPAAKAIDLVHESTAHVAQVLPEKEQEASKKGQPRKYDPELDRKVCEAFDASGAETYEDGANLLHGRFPGITGEFIKGAKNREKQPNRRAVINPRQGKN